MAINTNIKQVVFLEKEMNKATYRSILSRSNMDTNY